MSKTCAVSYGDRSFWAFDQSLSILLRVMIEAALADPTGDFTDGEIEQWRVTATLGSDVGLPLGSDWSEHHRQRFAALVDAVTQDLGSQTQLDGETVMAWGLRGDEPVIWRQGPSGQVPTGPIVGLGAALVRLVNGTLEKPPQGHWWSFGFDEAPGLIAMRGSTNG